ncbi:hypothetical protein E4K67_06185 [Desulfosporosinus fructosivorans]|uniref:Uncharacterized protein n=1 Tax=Desulfosporosinus fructosivorans TaxID=2018669 RepID=A0A4Z0R7H2_9FIRM|nr:hypothetical protein [Desulfosporosinus fructosivorans]TGE39052.1 hypothetical protein E4K67_06185 [Desulfosporosinus fructosivorans]
MFKITEDCVEKKAMSEYFSSEAKKGTAEFEELIKKFEAEPQYIFRMRDQDLEVYYIGYSDDCTRPRGFDPLDMYGEYYGCMDIQYLNAKGEYERL